MPRQVPKTFLFLRPVQTVTTLCIGGLIAVAALTACTDGNEMHGMGVAGAAVFATPAASPAEEHAAPGRAVKGDANVPPATGSAALREYREDADPSHAAVASYSD